MSDESHACMLIARSVLLVLIVVFWLAAVIAHLRL